MALFAYYVIIGTAMLVIFLSIYNVYPSIILPKLLKDIVLLRNTLIDIKSELESIKENYNKPLNDIDFSASNVKDTEINAILLTIGKMKKEITEKFERATEASEEFISIFMRRMEEHLLKTDTELSSLTNELGVTKTGTIKLQGIGKKKLEDLINVMKNSKKN
jgi:hypothetical protein